MLHKKQIWFQKKKYKKCWVFFSFFMLTAVRQMAFTTNSRYVSRFYACRQILNQFLKINCTQHSFLTIAYWHIHWRQSALNSAGALQGISGNFHPKNYSGRFLALLKSCETQEKILNFLRDLQDCKT